MHDSTVNQLSYLVHQIYLALDSGKEARVMILEISKAFDRVWHAGLICKLKAITVCNPLLNWIRSYLADRRQRVVFEGQSPAVWSRIGSGVPPGISYRSSAIFNIY